ncbi:MAG: YfhO family protein, partial [Clostridia bacterium]|nr:YfhO family protein [Clostridia bacterium]
MKPLTTIGRLPRRTARAALALYRRHEGSYLLFSFLLPLSLMALIYAVIGVFPFGRGSVLVLDLNGQYVYFFEALRDCVWGDSSLLYSFSRALGGEFLGMYAYYLASPLSYLVALFPRDGILDALCLMLLLKQGLSGLSFGYYLRRTTALSPTSTVLFSTVYSLTAYGVVMQHNTMWTDNVILLPLIALGIRALVTEKKYKLYTFSLILALMSNFYIGYMTCIFSVLYFLYIHLALNKEEKNPKGERLFFLRSCGRFALFSLIGGTVSALIVIPAAYSLTFGKNTFTSPTYEFTSKVDLFDIFTKFFFGSYDTVRPEGLPLVYCGTITLLLIPLYFISKRYSVREKAASALLSLLLLFSFSIQVIDMVWHGGQAPNWLNYRYSYMLTFLLIEMAAKAYHGIRDHSARYVVYAAAPLFLFL